MRRFEKNIVELMPALRRYASSLARSRADAEDLLQDAVEAALTNEHNWRGDNLRGWCLTIMTNLYRNTWRRAQSTAAMTQTQTIIAPESSGDGLERQRLIGALNRMDADQRAVLMLVVIEGYAYVEAAAMLDIPVGTVMSRLSRARRHLADDLTRATVIELRRPG